MNEAAGSNTAKTPQLTLSDIAFIPACRKGVRSGLLGWVSFLVNGTIHLDGIAVRRTRCGRLRLSFPARQSLNGQEFPYVRPLDDRTRTEIEAQVFRALRLEENAAR
jgi:hypothetical protein